MATNVNRYIFKLALGAALAYAVGNAYVTLPLGLTTLLAGGYWLGIPKRLLVFSAVVMIMAISDTTYILESSNYIGLRFGNIFLGAVVGMTVNITLWPNPDKDKLDPSFARAIGSIGQLYDRIIDDYRQGSLAANAQSRKQLRADIVRQLGAIESLLGNAKNELWSPFSNDTPYQRWIELQTHIESLWGVSC